MDWIDYTTIGFWVFMMLLFFLDNGARSRRRKPDDPNVE